MRMRGDPDPLYVHARRVLLDALDALAQHRASMILVGAQAIYLHVGDGDLQTAPYTTDGDVALDPSRLGPYPLIDEALQAKGFVPSPSSGEIGRWVGDANVRIDLLVPDAVAGPGRRSAHLESHGNRIARRARGLEAALVEHHEMLLTALDPTDSRQLPTNVAGPSALLVAKLHKMAERLDEPRQQRPKDALDIYRLLKSIPTATLTDGFQRLLSTSSSASITQEAVTHLATLFGVDSSHGATMAASAVGPDDDPATVAASCAALTQDLLDALRISAP